MIAEAVARTHAHIARHMASLSPTSPLPVIMLTAGQNANALDHPTSNGATTASARDHLRAEAKEAEEELAVEEATTLARTDATSATNHETSAVGKPRTPHPPLAIAALVADMVAEAMRAV